jgi:hypothetical protein
VKLKHFLNTSGSIKVINSDLVITDAHKKTQAKRDAARKRGMKKMTAA